VIFLDKRRRATSKSDSVAPDFHFGVAPALRIRHLVVRSLHPGPVRTARLSGAAERPSACEKAASQEVHRNPRQDVSGPQLP
jgi:hypothetical protein